MKIVFDSTPNWRLGRPDGDWRYVTINEPPAFNNQSKTYSNMANIDPLLVKTINQWALSSEDLFLQLGIENLSWTWAPYPLINSIFDPNWGNLADGSQGIRGVNIFLYNKKNNEAFSSTELYNSLAEFIYSALPKGPFVLIDDKGARRIEGLVAAPQSDVGALPPLAIFQGQVALQGGSTFLAYKTVVDPDIVDRRKPPADVANKYKARACLTVVDGNTALLDPIQFLFVPNRLAMVYEWPENGGTMLTIGPPFDGDDANAVAVAAGAVDDDLPPTDALDEIAFDIDPAEGERAFYWIDDKAQLCVAPFKFSAPQGGSGLGQSRSDSVTDSDNYWCGPISLGYVLDLDLSRHLSSSELKKTLGTAAGGGAASAADAKRSGWFKAETSCKAEAGKGTSYRGQGVSQTTMDSEILYIKNFDKKALVSKKNFPKSTMPYEATATESTFSRFTKLFKPQASIAAELRVQKMKTKPAAAGQPFRPEGVDLAPNAKKRLAAASVMGPAIREIIVSMGKEAEVEKNKASVKLGKKSASATAVTKYALGPINDDKASKDAWQAASGQLLGAPGAKKPLSPQALSKLKPALRTQQEWCHLWGHGDGGSEIPQNFVAGSRHCNTEQLAIETGRRTRSDDMKGKITAYLLPQTKQIKKAVSPAATNTIKSFGGYIATCKWDELIALYENSLKAYAAIKQLTANERELKKLDAAAQAQVAAILASLPKNIFTEATAIKASDVLSDPRKGLSNFLEWLTPLVTPQFPVGMFIRYKIFEGKKKIFDHIFDAQKESFDYNEFLILAEAVERIVFDKINNYEAAVNSSIYWKINNILATSGKDFSNLYGNKIGFRDIFTDKLSSDDASPVDIEKFIADVAIRARKVKPGASGNKGGDATSNVLAEIAKIEVYKYKSN